MEDLLMRWCLSQELIIGEGGKGVLGRSTASAKVLRGEQEGIPQGRREDQGAGTQAVGGSATRD